jgi:phosphatidylinositol alpha-1,6-mannosyltransferase
MAQFAVRRADAVILDSEVQRDAAIRLGCDPKKILKFPWFDFRAVRVKRSRIEVRDELGWNDNPIVICSRRHESVYGVQDVIEAIPEILNELPETRFLITGDGQLTKKLKRIVKDLGLQKYVKFLGRVSHEEATTYLNAADVNVSMSLSDGTSASLLEAMTLRVPSVVTTIPGNIEWIRNDQNGYLVPIKDSHQLADKVVQLLNDEELRRRMGESAFETVKTHADWLINSRALKALISKVANKKRQKSG